jgi:aminopeptidase N
VVRYRRLLMLSAGLLAAYVASAAAPFTSLLPRDVRPVHYALTVTPDAAALAFKAHADIDVQVLRATRSISVNALELTIDAVKVDARTASVKIDEDAQTATFSFDAPLSPGKHRLAIDYAGKIGTQPTGLFALDYTAGDAKRRALYTQFEPADARRMFPGWDEPGLKATFSLDVIVKESDGLAVSNMPVVSRTPLGDGRVRVAFAKSPKMSTYLLFFGLGDFERHAERRAGTEVAVITKRGDLPKAEYALAAGGEIVGWYNDYFGTPYPLPKLDLIAAPGQSQFFAAMENWGAIFYFERWLLLDPRISSVSDKQALYGTVAHEVAHQWFGNLVTMGWWDDLWLNEGFASWMGNRAVRQFHPEWNVDLQAVAAREAAIRLDARSSTHPVVQHIENPEALSQAFDSITYSKGSAVIRMLESYVGEEAWRTGVRNYIGQHAYGNTRSDDLWAAVGAAAGKPVTQIAHQFTLQPGVPLIRVEEAACAAGKTRLRLSQSQFQLDRQLKNARHWQVPVVASAGAASATLLVGPAPARTELSGCGPVVVNKGQKGYFRTLYSPAAFDAIAQHYATLDAVDQLGILSDAWALGLAAHQPAVDALNLLQSLPLEAPPEVWEQGAAIMQGLAGYLRDDAAAMGSLGQFAAKRFGPKLAQLGWASQPGEADNVSNLRNVLIAMLGLVGDPDVVNEARRRYEADVSSPIPGAQREAILGVVARNADRPTWERLHAQAKAETTPLIKSQLYDLLASPKDPYLAQAALALSLSGEPVETDAASIITRVAQWHPEMAFDFAAAHAEAVGAKVDGGARNRYIVGLAAESSDASLLPRLTAWAKSNVPRAAYRAADTVISGIRYFSTVKRERMPEIKAWLARQGT